MKKIFIIQDAKTKKYYGSFGSRDGFTPFISEAYKFKTFKKAFEELENSLKGDLSNVGDVFCDKIVEINTVYDFT